jgi:hypothetical protein
LCRATEKPATQNHETEQQQHAIPNAYRHRLAEDEHVINDTAISMMLAKRKLDFTTLRSEEYVQRLQKPGVGDETQAMKVSQGTIIDE